MVAKEAFAEARRDEAGGKATGETASPLSEVRRGEAADGGGVAGAEP